MICRIFILIVLLFVCLVSQVRAVSATGGTVTNYTLNGTNFTAHIFTNLSATNITFSVGGSVEVLAVAGGGAGGKASVSSGGGGAGGLIYTNLSVSAAVYTITVGSGAVGRTSSGTGASGVNSTFSNLLTAVGGGGGGGSSSQPGNGGSGGGASGSASPGTGTSGQGNNGGAGTGFYVGGGGGAGSVGTNGTPSPAKAGDGGLGLAYDLSGASLFYAGGGGGFYGSGTSGTGGSGVGGNGGSTPGNGMNGRGGGGGGGGSSTSGNGGSGIVIVRYLSGESPSQTTYLVSYHTNGATSGTAPASQTKTQNVTLVLAANTGNLARIGYTFSGWNTASNGTGTAYAESANYTVNTDAVMYAYWITNTPPFYLYRPNRAIRSSSIAIKNQQGENQ